MWKLSILAAFILVGAISCTKKTPQSPEAVLEEYIQTAMNAKSLKDKERLMELTTGMANEDLQKMTDTEFENQFIKTKFKFQRVKTKDLREESAGEVSLVYELEYQQAETSGLNSDMTNKKIAFFTKNEDGKWKIRETKNVKSLIEKKESLEVLNSASPAAATPAKDEKSKDGQK